MCCFTIESVAPSELILSISGNLVEGLIRFGSGIKTNDICVERILERKLRGNWSQMGHFPLSADPVNGGGSNIGHYLASLTRFLLQNGFSQPPSPTTHPPTREGLITRSWWSKLVPFVFVFLMVHYLRKHLSFSILEWFEVSVTFKIQKFTLLGSNFKIVADVSCDLSKLVQEGH